MLIAFNDLQFYAYTNTPKEYLEIKTFTEGKHTSTKTTRAMKMHAK